MIYPASTNKQLNDLIRAEKAVYFSNGNIKKACFRKSKSWMIFSTQRAFRVYEFRCYQRDQEKNPVIAKARGFRALLADRKKNRLCQRAGLELSVGKISPLVRFWHSNIVVNGFVGEGCVFHGNNVLGNKRTGLHTAIPRIGVNVDIGYGASIIGDIIIADNCVIGAGAVVTKSFLTPGTIIARVSAKEIKG